MSFDTAGVYDLLEPQGMFGQQSKIYAEVIDALNAMDPANPYPDFKGCLECHNN